MTKTILLSFVFLISITGLKSQETEIKIRSASMGFGLMNSTEVSNRIGVNYTADFSLLSKKNIFSLYLNRGVFIELNDPSDYFDELSLTIGREHQLNSYTFLEGHIGLGYFRFKSAERIIKTTVGLPLRLKLLFRTGKHFALGLNPNINISTLGFNFSGNLIFQYYF